MYVCSQSVMLQVLQTTPAPHIVSSFSRVVLLRESDPSLTPLFIPFRHDIPIHLHLSL